VEGPTEEECFPLIVKHFSLAHLPDIRFLGVRNTGDFGSNKHRANALEVYERLTVGDVLVPPAVRFIFDKDDKSSNELSALSLRTKSRMMFLDRYCYENYILNCSAIASVLSEELEDQGNILASDVEKTFREVSTTKNLYHNNPLVSMDNEAWIHDVDGAELLNAVFYKLTDHKVKFSKTKHAGKLTKWILKNDPDFLLPLADFLNNAISIHETV
jgi:hypothetical protein